MANLFHKIDYRGSGQITITDFERHFSEPDVIAFFESLEIGAMDAWTLFMSLDARLWVKLHFPLDVHELLVI